MNKPTSDEKEFLLERLHNNLTFCAKYLSASMRETPETFLLALRNVADANKGMKKLSAESGLNRESLYKMLSEDGNPRFESLWSVVEVLGLRLAIEATPSPSVALEDESGENGKTSGEPLGNFDTLSGSIASAVHGHIGTPGNMNVGIAAVNYPLPSAGPWASGTFTVPIPEYVNRMGTPAQIAEVTAQRFATQIPPIATFPKELQYAGDSSPKPAAATFKRTEGFTDEYANNVRFESTVLDLKLVFGQSDQSSGREIVEQHTAVTLPWPLVKTVLYFLALNIIGHESQNGPITIPPLHIPPPIVPPSEQDLTQLVNADALHERLTAFREAFLAGKIV